MALLQQCAAFPCTLPPVARGDKPWYDDECLAGATAFKGGPAWHAWHAKPRGRSGYGFNDGDAVVHSAIQAARKAYKRVTHCKKCMHAQDF